MKHILIFFIVALFTFGCDEEIAHFDQDIKLSKAVDIDIPDGPIKTATLKHEMNAADAPEFKEVMDRIVKIKLNALTYDITQYEGGDPSTTLENAIINVESGDGDVLASVTLENLDLEALNNAGEQQVSLTTEEREAIQRTLLEDKKIYFVVTGTVDNVPVSFTITTNLDMTVTYKVL